MGGEWYLFGHYGKLDTILAPHYNLTAEELDYIINYDIKYRQGKS